MSDNNQNPNNTTNSSNGGSEGAIPPAVQAIIDGLKSEIAGLKAGSNTQNQPPKEDKFSIVKQVGTEEELNARLGKQATDNAKLDTFIRGIVNEANYNAFADEIKKYGYESKPEELQKILCKKIIATTKSLTKDSDIDAEFAKYKGLFSEEGSGIHTFVSGLIEEQTKKREGAPSLKGITGLGQDLPNTLEEASQRAWKNNAERFCARKEKKDTLVIF